LSWYGGKGLEELADIHNMQTAYYAYEGIRQIQGFEEAFPGNKFFNEFTVNCPFEVGALNRELLEHSIIGGLDLGRFYPEYQNKVLFCVTETANEDDIDRLVDILQYLNRKGLK
jgi:glycine dehydrogenase subunit 1